MIFACIDQTIVWLWQHNITLLLVLLFCHWKIDNLLFIYVTYCCCCLGSGTGAWESALTNTLSPGDRTVSFLIGQFSLLWIDQQKRLRFNVDVIESEWGQGANLEILAEKIAADRAHTIKAVCIVHNETATGVTNNLAAVRRILGKNSFSRPHLHLQGNFTLGFCHFPLLGSHF